MPILRLLIASLLLLPPLTSEAQRVEGATPGQPTASFGGRSAQEWALLATADTTVRAQEVARLALRRMESAAAVPVLVERLTSTSAETRIAAAWALAAVGREAKPAVPALTAAARDSVLRARAFAFVALREIGPPAARAALPAVRESLADDAPGIRAEAIATVLALDSMEAIPDLVRMLRDEIGWVRIAALDALSALGPRARAAVPDIASFADDTGLVEAAAAVRALGRIVVDTTRLRHIPLLAEIRGSGHSLRGDGRGAYVDGVDGANVVLPLALNLMTYCPRTMECDTHTKNVPFVGPGIRALRFDLRHPVPGSGSVVLDEVVDYEGIMRVFWKRAGTPPQPVSIQAMPESDSAHTVERVQFELDIDGRPYVLQFGPWGMGQFNPRGARIQGDGTTAATVRRVSQHEWIVSAPPGSVGRLWDISDIDDPKEGGLYRFSFDVRFAQVAPHLLSP